MRRLTAALALAWLATAGCGGKVEEQVDPLLFAPQTATSGFGLVGGMHVSMVDASTGLERTLRVDAADLSGTFAVPARATVALTSDDGRTKQTMRGVSGTIAIDPITPPSAGGAPALGTVRVHVDVVLVDPARPGYGLHVQGDYDTALAYEG